jgi:hypothetical protein
MPEISRFLGIVDVGTVRALPEGSLELTFTDGVQAILQMDKLAG